MCRGIGELDGWIVLYSAWVCGWDLSFMLYLDLDRIESDFTLKRKLVVDIPWCYLYSCSLLRLWEEVYME